jgi:hypothetical protein
MTAEGPKRVRKITPPVCKKADAPGTAWMKKGKYEVHREASAVIDRRYRLRI